MRYWLQNRPVPRHRALLGEPAIAITTFVARSEAAQRRLLAAVVTTVMLGVIIAIIDSTIVNVALGAIAGNLGASNRRNGLGCDRLHFSAVIVMPLNGWLTAFFGRKRCYAEPRRTSGNWSRTGCCKSLATLEN